MDNTFYNNYKTLKDKLDYTYKGYNVKYLMPGYLNFVFDGITLSTRDVIKSFYDSSKSKDIRKVLDAKSPTIITFLIGRSDYKSLANTAKSYYPNSEVIDLSALPTVKFRMFGFSYIKHLLIAICLVFSRSVGHSFKTKLVLVAILVKIFNQINLLEKCKSTNTIEKYICFNSAYKEESILTEYFNKKQVETITLQHGIFCNFKVLIPFDYINFENLIAQKILCWGQSTIDFLTANGIDKSRLILMGNLKYKNAKIDTVCQTFKHCLVLLGRGLYIDTNNKLLEVLTSYSSKHSSDIVFYVKKHPFLSDEEHKQFADVAHDIIFIGKEHSVEEVLKSSMVDFSIAVNTTAYYESLALGKPCLRWTESENEDFYGMDDKFTDLEEFENKITYLKNMPQQVIKREMQDVIRYVFNPNL